MSSIECNASDTSLETPEDSSIPRNDSSKLPKTTSKDEDFSMETYQEAMEWIASLVLECTTEGSPPSKTVNDELTLVRKYQLKCELLATATQWTPAHHEDWAHSESREWNWAYPWDQDKGPSQLQDLVAVLLDRLFESLAEKYKKEYLTSGEQVPVNLKVPRELGSWLHPAMPTDREFKKYRKDSEYLLLDAHLRVCQFIEALDTGLDGWNAPNSGLH